MPISHVENRILKSYKCVSVKGKGQRLHRLVMENHLGRKLLPSEIVHHIDENKFNNDISNLELHSRQSHARLHSDGRKRPRNGRYVKCLVCGSQRWYCSNGKSKIPNERTYKCRKCFIATSKEAKKKHHKKIEAFSTGGERLAIFKNTAAAARYFEVCRAAVRAALKDSNKKIKGIYLKQI